MPNEGDIEIDGTLYTALEVAQAAELYPYTWVLQHEIKNESGVEMSFEKRKYLKAIYNDLSPKQVLLKPPQIGATVMSMLKALWVAKMLRKDIIYTLPTATDVYDIVGGSTNRIIAQNAILKSWVKDHDTVEQKSVGDNLIRFRGTFSPKQATMVPSSLNVHDEVDNSDPVVLTLYQTRQEGQEREEDKWQWYFSHPSLAGQGVDIYWQQSDMKEWYITCDDGHEQTLVWPHNIDIERQEYICATCHRVLSEGNRVNGVWKNKDGIEWDGVVAGGYRFSGWHVSQLMLYNKTAAAIIQAYNDPQKDRQYFYNYVLGLPYIGSEDRIEPSVVLRNCVDVVNPRTERIVFGVDTGTGLHLVAMNKDGVFYYAHETELTATKSPYDEVRKLLVRFPNSIAVFDQGGELMYTRQLQQEFPGRVFLCFYNKDKKTVDFIEWGEGDEYWKVRVDRNRMLTLAVEQMRDTGRVKLNGTKEEWQEFADMWGNIYREKIVVKDMKGKDDRSLYGTEYVWKRSGADHYCFVAGTQITTDHGEVVVEDIQEGDLVLTRKGYKRVYDAGLKRENQEVVTAYFSNGSYFTATPDHPLIHSRGKERLDSTSPHAILYSCKNQKVLYTKGLLTDATPIQVAEKTGFTLSPMGRFATRGTSGFISNYGLMPMALFLKGMSYTIKTKIRLITSLLTWCAKVESTIKATTYSTNFSNQPTGYAIDNISLTYALSPMLGDRLRKGKDGIAVMLIRASFWLFPKYLSVLSAILRRLHEAEGAVSSVAPDVVIVGLHENIVKRDVINLSVEDEHEYFANGILVSNCHSFVYALVGMQRYGGEQAKVVGDSALSGLPIGRIATPDNNDLIVGGLGAADFSPNNRVF